jgi:hypothetical protein
MSTVLAQGGILAELSRSWVDRVSQQLTSSGRRLEGGWPGTLSEARRLLVQSMSSPGADIQRGELEDLARTLYEQAKSQWLAVAARCPAPLDD